MGPEGQRGQGTGGGPARVHRHPQPAVQAAADPDTLPDCPALATGLPHAFH